MITLTAAKRTKGIDELIDSYTPQLPEVKRKMLVDNNVFADLFQQYVESKKAESENSDLESWIKGEPKYKRTEHFTTLLKPEEIGAFLSLVHATQEDINPVLGVFLTRLIQNSYNAGYNDFILESPAGLHIGSFLQGKCSNPIKMDIRKAKGMFYAQEAEHIDLTIETDVFGYAEGVKYSSVTILGGAATGLGNNSVATYFHVTGDVHGELAERARGSTYLIEGEFKRAPGLKRWMSNKCPLQCTFKSPRRTTIEVLEQYVPAGNRIIFVDADGKEEIMRDF